MWHLVPSQWRLRILCAYESFLKPGLWHWNPLSSFILKKNWGQLFHLSLMAYVGCATLSGKDMPHIIFPASCMDLESKGRSKEKELTGSQMTVMNSRTQGLSSVFPPQIPPEPWWWGSKTVSSLLRRGTLIVNFYSSNVFTKTHFLFLLSAQIFPSLLYSWTHMTEF